jgi:hypothetical protein
VVLGVLTGMGFEAVWVMDFEFTTHSVDPRPQTVVCMVAEDLVSGRTLRLGPDSLDPCPFDLNSPSLFVAFYAIAEASCFERLGWPLPRYWLDLWAEEVRLQNGGPLPRKLMSLLATRQRYELPIRDVAEKDWIRQMIGRSEYTTADLPVILDYCADDVSDTVELFHRMGPAILASGPGGPATLASQAVLRGRFAAECAMMTAHGLPWDVDGWQRFLRHGSDIKLGLIAETEAKLKFQLYEGTRFVATRFEAFLEAREINWPRLASGQLCLDKETFSKQAKRRKDLREIQNLRSALSQLQENSLAWQSDGRVRVNLNPFGSKTGRSQPSNSKYPFGLPKWARCFLKPEPDYTLAYLDYRSQEIQIGSVLSDDNNLKAAYSMGDPYMAFAIQTGQAPEGATKHTHKAERNAAKPVVLASGYGMGEHTMAEQNQGMSVAEARNLLRKHRELYPSYWRYVEHMRLRAAACEPLHTALGWRFQHRQGAKLNERSWGNWPIQSCGSDIMRWAVIRCADAGIRPIATVHDALVFQVRTSQADELLELAKREMETAAEQVLGEPIAVDLHRTDWPNNYMDEDGDAFYSRLLNLLAEAEMEAA